MGDERGAVAVFVALLMVPLVALAALAVDIGMLVNERRNAQIAADQASLAAAAAAPDCDDGDPIAEGQALGAANGFPGVSVTQLSAGEYRADTSVTVDTGFANVFGVDSMTTEATSTAECRLLEKEIPAMFAGATDEDCDPGLSFSGTQVTGDIHSNGDLSVTGSGSSVSGDATYVDSSHISPGNPGVNADEGDEEPFPVDFDVSDYAPGGSKAIEAGADYFPDTGDITIRPPLREGLYYTTGDITLNRSGVGNPSDPFNVTLVSNGGEIKVSGNNQVVAPYFSDHLLAFSTLGDCETNAIQFSGTSSSWSGIMFAPEGQIQVSGSNTSRLTGALIGATINMSGSGFTLSTAGLPVIMIPAVRITH